MVLGNDTRGWIMTALSGIACMLGALIVCVDLLICQIPLDSCRCFKIQDSNAFLSSSLSLSFGVMLFSSLYNMLPSSKSSLINGGFSPKAAAWTLIACFLVGAAGIQLLSRILHRYIPSHVVDCDHTHNDDEAPHDPLKGGHHVGAHSHHNSKGHRHLHRFRGHHTANSPLSAHRSGSDLEDHHPDGHSRPRRPSLHSNFSSRVSQLVSARKDYCDKDGQCYGFTDPCGIDCFRNIQARGGSKVQHLVVGRHPSLHKHPNSLEQRRLSQTESTPLLDEVEEEHSATLAVDSSAPSDVSHSSYATIATDSPTHGTHHHSPTHDSHDHDGPEHHHHVPTNAFLSIGMQTCMAIALHKLPEGFITYATNHANPKLGLSVFLALFIHNITEGFAMALPLYLALQSRTKAVVWAALLGGASQPLGAAVAALWLRFAGSSEPSAPSDGLYGCLFACTAGILASVALQLFGESFDLTHDRTLCLAFAFVGMGILGATAALTA